MSDPGRLIDDLAANLRPVRRLSAPWRRATAWIALCATLVWLVGGGLPGPREAIPERIAFACAALTALCATLAALSSAVPGRSTRWTYLPLPPLLLWIGFSSWDCWLTTAAARPLDEPSPLACFRFIVIVSLPLAASLFLLLRRTYCVRPALTATLAGLAAATAAAATLEACHAHAASLPDMTAHAAAILLVIALTRTILPKALT